MVSGTDEHGTPILVAADQQGVTARDLADTNNVVIVQDLVDLGLSYDLFTRTTAGNHYAVVQEMFRTVRDNGYMVQQVTRSAISPSTGRTLPDRYIEGTCPICGAAGARGDQCDTCGNQLDPTDLIDPRSRINGEAPEFVESTHWFLDLPALAAAPAATSSTPPTSSTRARASTARPPSSWSPPTGSSTCRPWPPPWAPGSMSASPRAPGAPMSSSSPRTSWTTSARAP